MTTGPFYGSLAASASVFIGISSAYLVNKISNTEERRNQIENKINETKKQLEQARAREEKYSQRVEEIEEQWQNRKIKSFHKDVDDFIENHISKDEFSTPAEVVDWSEIIAEAREYFDIKDEEEIPEDFLEVIRSRRDEIEQELATASAQKFVPRNTTDATDLFQIGGVKESFPKIVRMYKEEHDIKNLREDTREALKSEYEEEQQPLTVSGMGHQQYNPIPQNQTVTISESGEKTVHSYNKLHQTKASTRISTLEDRVESLQDEKESIEIDVLTRTLRANTISIIASVIAPLFSYLLILVGWPRFPNQNASLDTVLIFIVWLGGLGYALFHIWNEINNLPLDTTDS